MQCSKSITQATWCTVFGTYAYIYITFFLQNRYFTFKNFRQSQIIRFAPHCILTSEEWEANLGRRQNSGCMTLSVLFHPQWAGRTAHTSKYIIFYESFCIDHGVLSAAAHTYGGDLARRTILVTANCLMSRFG